MPLIVVISKIRLFF